MSHPTLTAADVLTRNRLCATCTELTLVEQCAYLQAHHTDPERVRRWQDQRRAHNARLQTLGPCSCGRRLTAADAARDVRQTPP
jgi:hypothetical protein